MCLTQPKGEFSQCEDQRLIPHSHGTEDAPSCPRAQRGARDPGLSRGRIRTGSCCPVPPACVGTEAGTVVPW